MKLENEQHIVGDEGTLPITIYKNPQNDHLFLNFNKKIRWLAFNKEELLKFIEILNKHLKNMYET